jgi:hypothetical protein
MSLPIEVKLFAAASAFPALQAVLGSSPFRWYNVQLTEGSAYPAIVILKVSGPKLASYGGINSTSRYRIQFTIWEGPTPDVTDSTLSALRAFLAQFSGTAITGNYSPVVNELRRLYAETQPPIYQTIVDAMVTNNDTT